MNNKMEEFINYKTFLDFDEAMPLLDLLEDNGIPFKINDSTVHFDLSATSINPLENGIIIQIREVDRAKIDLLNQKGTAIGSNNAHYMYSLSDNDIIDAIVNPEDWSEEEHRLAEEIFKQRNLNLTAEIIKSSRKEKNKDATEKQLEEKRIISSGSSWFLAIGILSAISIIAVITKQNFYFFLGLGINSVIIGIMHGIYQSLGINIMIIGYILTFLISGLFALIWKKSKDGDRKMYLTGLIIYSIDTVIFLFAKEWVALGFHVFALIGIYMGYKKLLERIKAVGKTK